MNIYLVQFINSLVLSSIVLLFTTFPSPSKANISQSEQFKVAADSLCTKMKTCMLNDIAQNKEEYPPQMAQMIEQMTQNMCASFYEFSELLEVNMIDEYGSAIKCIQSVEKQSCEAINEGLETAECKAFEKQLSQYSNEDKALQ
uniref:hypothetical protein n=1 Tax=Ningiella ruwaisensis TaxID=2364274 RepID=UPI00109F8A80|nr:hypothetical protein [Ningiella ruwaisensis]